MPPTSHRLTGRKTPTYLLADLLACWKARRLCQQQESILECEDRLLGCCGCISTKRLELFWPSYPAVGASECWPGGRVVTSLSHTCGTDQPATLSAGHIAGLRIRSAAVRNRLSEQGLRARHPADRRTCWPHTYWTWPFQNGPMLKEPAEAAIRDKDITFDLLVFENGMTFLLKFHHMRHSEKKLEWKQCPVNDCLRWV